MNTIQLTLLWYGGLAIAAVLSFAGLEKGLWYFVAAIALVTTLAIYTFSPTVKARKRWVVVFVLLPGLLTLMILYAWNQYTEHQAVSFIKPDQVEAVDFVFSVDQSSGYRVSGKLRNRSAFFLTQTILEYSASESGEVFERESRIIYLRVPPGEARTFVNEPFPLTPLTFKRLTAKGNSLKFDIRVSGVRGSRE